MPKPKLKNELAFIDNRINRLVGQIEGVRRMIHSGRSSDEVTQQILAARQALSKLGLVVLKEGLSKMPEKHHKKIDSMLEKIFRI
ncbi:hypothetical protein A2690_00930 [Candidatus Roizmanbacteria bacterium RIFCSPHIGHO2_01_FULL_39_12b]|uniref:Uncharacterized protein n=1 Tax=Candidatus Roizmanbacteria bacterium RIFCSPHIGHO2_01_FULL_39_12b TaxID=1802030 RepID=A0A1F7GBP5_9BACT|nr:MAG: hypothetical protein A2690_00930 [Candidatus Roizmanbacteria bacterium RIFCSPHIGHO2_01_FULL_39_12b]OGK47354.1 MAG: hypothetical protein A3B46_02205 [Candidatus Roizmanbacteria bacterium RIFCSPLOWO2_01_FULL_39_19]